LAIEKKLCKMIEINQNYFEFFPIECMIAVALVSEIVINLISSTVQNISDLITS